MIGQTNMIQRSHDMKSRGMLLIVSVFAKEQIYIQSNLSIATTEGSSEKRLHKTGRR